MKYRGFAVFDLETTGLFPGGHDRIVEIGLALADPDGQVTDTWETVVNPGRDLGPSRIHGLHGADMKAAPTFLEVADEFRELLDGRTLVAHNASFDTRFLLAEWRRAKLLADERYHLPYLCTMQLGSQLMPGAGRTLADCCAAFDIVNPRAHSAMADAGVTARLLEAYLALPGGEKVFDSALQRVFHADVLAVAGGHGTPVSRVVPGNSPDAPLARVLDHLPNEALTPDERDYLALLDKCLADDVITTDEQEALDRSAEELLQSRGQRNELHNAYFNQVCRTAWEDDFLSRTERRQLEQLANMLRLNASVVAAGLERPVVSSESSRNCVAELTAKPGADVQLPELGSMIVLTGDMNRARSDWTADIEAAGFVVHPAVTKKVKLVVAADPDSLSGKAKKARQYGIPIVGEDWLQANLTH